ncbi:hypothetical protein LC724_03490 [Blautia sp. RD014234]|nr:hypothetical protein [Blautia parvula]
MKENLDMSRYFAALEAFKEEHHDEAIKYWKTEKAFDNMIKRFRKKKNRWPGTP